MMNVVARTTARTDTIWQSLPVIVTSSTNTMTRRQYNSSIHLWRDYYNRSDAARTWMTTTTTMTTIPFLRRITTQLAITSSLPYCNNNASTASVIGSTRWRMIQSPKLYQQFSSSSSSSTPSSSVLASESSSSSSTQLPPGYSFKSRSQKQGSSSSSSSNKTTSNLLLQAGLPFVLFSVLASWVVSQALSGKLKEMEASQGKSSLSIRQVAIQKEHDEMIERLNTIRSTDFDNTKRIVRPEEVLEQRRMERQKRNVWYRRLYRWIKQEK
jgi:hypothetical protein